MKQNYNNSAKSVKKLIGHTKYQDMLVSSFKSNKLAQCWLFAGTKSIGKATLLHNVAGSILSQALPANDEISKIPLRNHPDLFVIDKENTDDLSTEITVDDIRSISDFVNLKSITTGHKIIIIDPIDDLNLHAANALLKLLEEAPANTYYFLVSHNIEKTLPTIRSRCNVVELNDLSQNEAFEVCKSVIDNIDEFQARKLLDISINSPGLVLKILQNDGINIYKQMLEIFSEIPIINMEKIDKLSADISGPKDKVKWEIFTFFYGLSLQKLIKLLLKIDVGSELIENEHSIIKKMITKQTIQDFLFVAETAESVIRSTEMSHLDKKQIIFVLIEIIKDSIQ